MVFPILRHVSYPSIITNIIVLSCTTHPWRNINVTHAIHLSYLYMYCTLVSWHWGFVKVIKGCKGKHQTTFWTTRTIFKVCCPGAVRLSEPLSEQFAYEFAWAKLWANNKFGSTFCSLKRTQFASSEVHQSRMQKIVILTQKP